MKSIFKRKTLIALNLMLLLGMSTKGHSGEGGSISSPQQLVAATASNSAPVTVAVTIRDPFTPSDRDDLREIRRQVGSNTPTVSTFVGRIGSPDDLMIIPRNPSNTVFSVINHLVESMGTRPTTGPTNIFALLAAINGSISSVSGATSTSLTEVLTRIGAVAPSGSDLFTQIAGILAAITTSERNVRGDIALITPAITRESVLTRTTVTTSETAVLAAIARIATSVGTGNTDITSILRLIGAAPVILYQTIIDGDTRILNAIGGISTQVGTGNTNITQILTNIGILTNFMGSPTGCHTTLFSTLHTILEEIRTMSIATPCGFKKYLKFIHEGQERLEQGQAQLGNGMLRLLQQLCVGDAGERYLPKALVGINEGVQEILDHLSHSSGASGPSRESAVIIELLEDSSEKTELLARSNLHIHKELREIREQTARVVEILEDDDRRPSSPHAKGDEYEELVETVGTFKDPRFTVAASLEAIVGGFGKLATHEHVTVLTKGLLALNNQQVQMSKDMKEVKQELRETKGMLAQLIAALSSHRPHHDGHDSGSESDCSSR